MCIVVILVTHHLFDPGGAPAVVNLVVPAPRQGDERQLTRERHIAVVDMTKGFHGWSLLVQQAYPEISKPSCVDVI